jgi:hypothetical protein
MRKRHTLHRCATAIHTRTIHASIEGGARRLAASASRRSCAQHTGHPGPGLHPAHTPTNSYAPSPFFCTLTQLIPFAHARLPLCPRPCLVRQCRALGVPLPPSDHQPPHRNNKTISAAAPARQRQRTRLPLHPPSDPGCVDPLLGCASWQPAAGTAHRTRAAAATAVAAVRSCRRPPSLPAADHGRLPLHARDHQGGV